MQENDKHNHISLRQTPGHWKSRPQDEPQDILRSDVSIDRKISLATWFSYPPWGTANNKQFFYCSAHQNPLGLHSLED